MDTEQLKIGEPELIENIMSIEQIKIRNLEKITIKLRKFANIFLVSGFIMFFACFFLDSWKTIGKGNIYSIFGGTIAPICIWSAFLLYILAYWFSRKLNNMKRKVKALIP
jgi:hypothetical protein